MRTLESQISATIASLSCLISFLQLSHFLTSIGQRVCDDKLWIADGFQFLDPNRVILQLIVVSAELLRAAHIFLTMVLGFIQNRVELGNDFIDFPLHPIDSSVLGREASIQSLVLGCKACVNGLKNHRSLIGEELLDIFGVLLLGHGDGVNETGTATFSIGDGEMLSKEGWG